MKKPQKPRPTGSQMGGADSASQQPQQSDQTPPQAGSSTPPPVRYTDWASI
jgi:hypothetical protein